MWLAAIASTWASPPAPVVENVGDHGVRGTVELGLAPAELRALLENPVALYRITNANADISVSPDPDPDCRRVTMMTPHPVMDTSYVSRECDTAAGVTARLVESRQLSHLSGEWTLEPRKNSTLLRYELHVRTNMPVPAFMVRGSTRKGVQSALERLQQAYPVKSVAP